MFPLRRYFILNLTKRKPIQRIQKKDSFSFGFYVFCQHITKKCNLLIFDVKWGDPKVNYDL